MNNRTGGAVAAPREVLAFHAQVMSRLMADLSGLIAQHDLTPAQISTLFRLRRAGSMSVTEVAAALGLSPATSSHLVDRLSDRGLVQRRTPAQDARRRTVTLTDQGQEFLDSFDAGLATSLERLLEPVPRHDLVALGTALRAVLASLP
jgi:DNA-binding MarR family transcriptional regulator